MQRLAPNIGEAADQIGLRHRGAFRLRHPIFGDDAQRLGGVGDIRREFAAGLREVGGAHRRRHHAPSLIDQLGQILGGGVEFSRERGSAALALRWKRSRSDARAVSRTSEFLGGLDGGRRLDLDRGRDRGRFTWIAGATGDCFSA